MAPSMLRPTRLFERDEAAALPRIFPFALFMAFIALESLIRWLDNGAGAAESGVSRPFLWLYPVRAGVVLISLIYFWPAYGELRHRLWHNWREALLTVGVGVGVYLAWVRMDWSWATQGDAPGYNPLQGTAAAGVLLAGIRLFGAAVVVPLMEELFWRSFLIRYLVAAPFASVRLGTFTPLSFVATVVLFGLEHHLWLAGMMAGVAYTLLLYQTRRLWPCILAHAVTNLILGLHVLLTRQWYWW